ncbi:ankyrin repeat domain-containing protein [Candidatus Cardinium hertigii]|uniref:ankyrin repeat domain-containing protein n=1 Tax=Candidatus Cardinium hertigii TaxID=247481 RepID=UPI000D708CBC
MHATYALSLPFLPLKRTFHPYKLSNKQIEKKKYSIHLLIDPIIDLIIQNKADVNQQNKRGETALHLAAKKAIKTVLPL